MNNALKEYQEKIKSGEIIRQEPKNPLEKAKANPKSMRAAVNAKCWDCVGQSRNEVTLCPSEDCPLWQLRPWQKK